MTRMTTDPRSLEFPGKTWITDSRTYNLIWLGRWIERAYNVVTTLDAILHSSEDEESFIHQAQAYAAACGIDGDPVAGLRGSLETCVRVARDDATQVGPLELIRELNGLLEELPSLWTGSTGNETSAAIAAIRPRLDVIAEEIENRWFRHLDTD